MGRVREAPVVAEAAVGPAVTVRPGWLSKAAVAAAATACLAGYLFVYSTGRASEPIRSDGFSYYVYLPSWFLFHDTTLASVARDCCGGEFPEFTAIIRWPRTRRWVNAHPIGVAVLQTPFFVAAHALTRWTNLSPDGFTLYYQHGAGIAGLAWTIAGLVVLRRLLLRRFSDGVVAATVVTLLLGTNLYHYATFDSSYSHAYSFFLFAALLDLTERWHESATTMRSILLGIAAGLIVLTRHTNAILLLVVPLYGVRSVDTLRGAVAAFTVRKRQVLIAAAVGTAVVIPQLLLYYQATGRILVSSYGSLGFNFGSPQLWGVLFSVQKGVFFWSPLLLLALAGLMTAPVRAFLLPGALILALDTYLIASWWDWQFGGSYGHRGFVDLLPLFALGLAAFFARVAHDATARRLTAAACMLLVSLSVFQMLQYWYGIVPFSDMTWDRYREVFLTWR